MNQSTTSGSCFSLDWRAEGWSFCRVRRLLTIAACVSLGGAANSFAQSVEEIEAELNASSDEHMREELGVNPITSPSIAGLLRDLETFRPIPIKLIESTDHGASFSNRLQTGLHFGSLVADGFMLTIAERPQDVQNIGKELIRQSKALGVGERLTTRSKSLFELSDKGDWVGMREELVRTQEDVEQSMMELHDEEMAHMISLGGWLRGFQLGATSTVERYSKAKAALLGRVEVVEYFLDRLDTLNPRLKKTDMVTEFIKRIREIRLVLVETKGEPPTEEQVLKLKKLADAAEAVATARVDSEGKFLEKGKL
jgi:hypothetical protein